MVGGETNEITENTMKTHHCFLIPSIPHQLALEGRKQRETRLHIPQVPVLKISRNRGTELW